MKYKALSVWNKNDTDLDIVEVLRQFFPSYDFGLDE